MALEKLTLTYVGRFTTAKDGSPLVSKKTGKPYTSLRVKSNEYGDRYISGFDGAETKDWKIGDVVEVEVEEKGEYLNLSVPRVQRNGIDETKLNELANKVTTLTLRFNKLMSVLVEKNILEMPAPEKAVIPGTTVEYPDEAIDPEFDPFGSN